MAAVNSSDFSISGSKVIDYTGAAHGAAGAVYHSIIEFHRWLQEKAADASATGDDLLDITLDTPSDRATDNFIVLQNGYTITDTAIEHLYDGSIIENLGAGSQQIWDGLVVIAKEGMDLQIIQNGAQVVNDFWNTIPNGETTKGLNRDVPNGISHRFLLKVNTTNADIDGRRFIGTTRVDFSTKPGADTYGKTFSEFKVNGSARGNNVLALTYADDLNDTSSAAGFSSITNTEGYRQIDVDANSTPEPYYSEWNRDIYTINQLYQRSKYLTRGDAGNVGTLYGIDAKIFRGITHEIQGTQATGIFVQPEQVTWTGGSGQLLAIDSTTSATKMWIQVLTGVVPTSGTITGAGAATFTASGNTERTVSTPFCGVSTGSAIIGAYGFGVEALDLGPSDTVFDLDGTPHSAPNNVTFSVSGVVNGEDRILVGPESGGNLDIGQFLVQGALVGGEGSITVDVGTETPGTGTQSESDTPNTGTIRILGSDGVFHRVTYTGYSVGAGTMTFTGCVGAPAAADNTSCFISYIDALYDGTATTNTYTATYAAPGRNLFIRVRDGGTAGDTTAIKTFETTATLGSSSTGVTAIRTSDA